MSKYSIYAIQNRITKRLYIGCSCDVGNRIRQHFSQLEGKQKTAYYPRLKGRDRSQWQIDYDEHGIDSFVYYILEDNIDEANKAAREQYWVQHYNATDPDYGYNSRLGKKAQAPIQFLSGVPDRRHESGDDA